MLAALQPQRVDFFPPNPLLKSELPVVVIKMFGEHNTGGHSRPYLGPVVVVAGSNSNYTPKPGDWRVGARHFASRKVAEGVYEVFNLVY